MERMGGNGHAMLRNVIDATVAHVDTSRLNSLLSQYELR